MLKVGLIGLGGMGRGHGHIFRDHIADARVTAGADPSPDARASFGSDHPEARAYESHDALLAESDVDIVVISTPTYYHREAAIAAMESGRDVLIEKPLARTVEDGHRMIEVSQRTGKLLMVAHCRRYDNDWGTIKRVFEQGTLGTPWLWRHVAAGYVPSPWFVDDKLSGGPLFDGAVHDHDFGNWIFGDPQDVLASEIRLGNDTAVNTASAIVRYKGGHQMVHSWSWDVAGLHALDILGPGGGLTRGTGAVSTDGLDMENYGYYCLTPRKQPAELLRFDKADMYVAEDRHFVECLSGGAECLSPATEAIKAVAVGEAILQAARGDGHAPINW